MNKIITALIFALTLALPYVASAKNDKEKLKDARSQCLKERPALKGKELKKCIRRKVKKKSKGSSAYS